MVNSYLSNEDIQGMLDNAQDGTTFNFVDKNYDGISLVINKKVLIKSDSGSTVSPSSNNNFCFKFNPESAGSILLGFNIIADNKNGVIIDGADNVTIANNTIVGSSDAIVANNTEGSIITSNKISKSSVNGIKVQSAYKVEVSNNTVSNCVRSGIELTDISYSHIANNNVSDNKFNGITLYGNTKYNLIEHNDLYRNLNGIYIDSASEGDVITANSAYSSFKNPSSELGGFETGNGILFGPTYQTVNKKQVSIYNNYLAHNENFQVKNNPSLSVMKIGANYYNSNDDEDTFVCPMLLSRILLMKVDMDSVPNGLAIQITDNGNPVDDMGTFYADALIDGVSHKIKVENGKAILELDTSEEHTVEIKVGKQVIKNVIPAKSQTEDSSQDDQGSNTEIEDVEIPQENEGVGNGEIPSEFNSTVPSQSLSGVDNVISSGVNTSSVVRQDTSKEGQLDVAQGEAVSASPSDNSGESKKAYEMSESAKDTSKSISDISVVIIIGVAILIIVFAVGFKRKNDFN